MEVSSRGARLIFEAAEAIGIPRRELAFAIGEDAEALVAGPFVTWVQFIALSGALAERLDRDPERLRQVGRQVARMPSFAMLRKVAGDVVSLRMLFEFCAYWLAPSMFPHLHLSMDFLSEDRVRFSTEVPEPHPADSSFFYIFEGVVIETPTYLGLPPARLETSAVTARGVASVFALPPSPSVLGRARRLVRAVLHSHTTLAYLETQRGELEAGYQALQRMSEEFRSLLERLPDLVVIHRNGEILWVNRSTCVALGYESANDLVGRSIFDIVESNWQTTVKERMTIPAGSRAPQDVTEGYLLRKDGEVIVVEVTPAQAVVFGGASARLLVGRDVTERLRMQQRLVTADRLAAVGILAAGVAHEINNPLTYVLGNLELATRKLAPLGDAAREARESLAIAVEGGGRIRSIVRDLLTLARARTAETLEVDIGPIDVRAAMEATLMLMGTAVTERARIVRDYAPTPQALSDGRIGQVLLNLVVNATEAMHETDASTNELRVRTFVDDEGRVVIEIGDTGPGIPMEMRRRIFDPFFTTKSVGNGTGLGLAISERIVAELGGEISLSCPKTGGAIFRVALRPHIGESAVAT